MTIHLLELEILDVCNSKPDIEYILFFYKQSYLKIIFTNLKTLTMSQMSTLFSKCKLCQSTRVQYQGLNTNNQVFYRKICPSF